MNDSDVNKIGVVIKEEITASEKRLRQTVGEEITASEKRLRQQIKQLSIDIGDFIDDNLLPIIEAKADKVDIERIEHKVDKFIDRSLDHESRIREIEQVPVVAHQLRLKKLK